MALPRLQQAQRRILEEQYAANPPAKVIRGTSASVPPAAATRKAVKCAAPATENIPEAVTAVEVVTKSVAPEPEVVAASEHSPKEAEAEAAGAGAEDPPVVAEAAEAESEAAQGAEAVLPETEAGTQVRKDQNFISRVQRGVKVTK